MKSALILSILGGLAGILYAYKKRNTPSEVISEKVSDWLEFGNSKLDVSGQQLKHGAVTQSLTFRESKLLYLFASNPGQLLERDYILQQVWADEGVLIGRSIDVFVSRLRKKLASDSSLRIVAVHGIGYRLEILKPVDESI